MAYISAERWKDISQKFARAIRSDNMVSMYVKNYKFRMTTLFSKQFPSAPGLMVEMSECGHVMLRETKRKKKLSQCFQSKKVSLQICNQHGIRENIKLVFFFHEEEGCWMGYLVPQIKHAYGWKELEGYSGISRETTWEDSFCLDKFKERYSKVIEPQEIAYIYEIGTALAERIYSGVAEDFWYYKLVCISSLLKELAAGLRNICDRSGVIAFDSRFHTYSESQNLSQRPFPSCSEIEEGIMLKEFMELLSKQERFMLEVLYRRNFGVLENISWGLEMRRRMSEAHNTLKQKACDYWEKDYINSFFETDVICS